MCRGMWGNRTNVEPGSSLDSKEPVQEVVDGTEFDAGVGACIVVSSETGRDFTSDKDNGVKHLGSLSIRVRDTARVRTGGRS